QIMHKGAYDGEAESIRKIKNFAAENGFKEDFSAERLHHEIYLSDPRKCAPEKLRTVIRHPVSK
ncbi:MAG: GyrI-like domain-containing protein, partial [Muribaculaceae bacterium]|nr:GyrI-like domain-containing protein [Muribaculaceae bacterium]